jgi:hypothetical protein
MVQEFVPSRPYLFQHGEDGYAPHEAVWGLFCIGDAYGGGFLRMAPQESRMGAINSSRGALEGIIYEV